MARNEPPSLTRASISQQEVFHVLADPTCRTILGLISDRAMTATEMAEATDTPLSTVYRKLDQLIETPLVESTYRVVSDGAHARQYRCEFDRIQIQVDGGSDGAFNVHLA